MCMFVAYDLCFVSPQEGVDYRVFFFVLQGWSGDSAGYGFTGLSTPKSTPTSIQNRTKIDQTSTQNQFKIVPKSTKTSTQNHQINQSKINKPINQSTNQPINQSTNQPTGNWSRQLEHPWHGGTVARWHGGTVARCFLLKKKHILLFLKMSP